MRFFATTCVLTLCATHAGAASIHDDLVNFDDALAGLGTISKVLEEGFDGLAANKTIYRFGSGLTMIATAPANEGSAQPANRAPIWSEVYSRLYFYIANESFVSFNFGQPVNAVYFNGYNFFEKNDRISLTGTVIEEIDGRRQTEEVFSFRYAPGTFFWPGDGWETWPFGIVSDKAFEQVTFLILPRPEAGFGFLDITAWAIADDPVIIPTEIPVPPTPVPLPAPALLLLSAVVSLGLWGRRKPPAALSSVA